MYENIVRSMYKYRPLPFEFLKNKIQTLFVYHRLRNRYIHVILIMRVSTDVCVCVVFPKIHSFLKESRTVE